MFQSNNTYSPFVEARVITVDLKRNVCKCITKDGQMLNNVRWGHDLGTYKEIGSSTHPLPKETVAIALVSGEPVIFMSLGLLKRSDDTLRATINGQRSTSEFYNKFNNSFVKDPLRRNGAMPDDVVPGDKVFANDAGSLFGLLRGGTFVAKASALAQVIVSRMDDLLRLVSRNYEMFSDAMTHYSVNHRGKLYTYLSFFRTTASSRAEIPDYYEVFGNVEVGDEIKDGVLSGSSEGVDPTDLIKMQRIPAKDGQGDVIGSRWVSTYSLEGKRLETSSTASGSDYVKVTTDNQHWRIEVQTEANVSYIDITPHLIQLKTDGGPEVLLNGTNNSVTVNATDVTVNCTNSTTNATTAAVTATDIDLTGTVNVTGDVLIDAANTLKIGTLDLKTHVHNQVVIFGNTQGPANLP